jgi:hypothetical protein
MPLFRRKKAILLSVVSGRTLAGARRVQSTTLPFRTLRHVAPYRGHLRTIGDRCKRDSLKIRQPTVSGIGLDSELAAKRAQIGDGS